MLSPEQSLSWFLRITALVLLTAAVAVVMPHAWMNAVHAGLGLGELPASPMVGYLTRSLSALYAALGATYWHVAGDVRRYLPLVRFSVPVTMIFGVTLTAIDIAVALPTVWTAVEGPFILGFALVQWWLVRRV